MNNKFGPLCWLLCYGATTFPLLLLSVQANPTCHEYWDAECSTGTRNTFHALTGGNCSRTDANPNALGTACLTENLVALTQVEPNTCRKTFGSVQRVSECVPYGRVNGRDVYMYCTAEGCDDFGKTCAKDEVTQPGQIKLWDACGNNVPDYYPDPLPTDGECYALPDKGASVRLTCLNNLYMQVQVYHDLACETLSPWHQAPTFLMDGYDQCFPFEGADGSFALKVEEACRCGNEETPPPLNPAPDTYGDDVLRFDVMYNFTVNGSNCLEGSRLWDFETQMERETNTQVNLDISNAALHSRDGRKWWYLSMALRFLAIPQPIVIDFQQDVDAAFADGRVLRIIETTCGHDTAVDVTINATVSAVWDHQWTGVPTAPPSAAATRGCRGWTVMGWWWGLSSIVVTLLGVPMFL